jgi:hypothetical protein
VTYDIKALNRVVFREAFNVNQDEDIIKHPSANQEAVYKYNHESGDGPDPGNLQFDMKGPYNNLWNLRVIECLQERFAAKLASSGQRLPQRTSEYIREMIVEKFKRYRVIWNHAQPMCDRRGIPETPEDVEKRVGQKKEATLALQRRATRRLSVRPFPLYDIHKKLKALPRNMRGGNSWLRRWQKTEQPSTSMCGNGYGKSSSTWAMKA